MAYYSTVEYEEGNEFITNLIMNNDNIILPQVKHRDDGTIYRTEVYLQPSKLNVLKPGARDQFDLKGFVAGNNLVLVGESMVSNYVHSSAKNNSISSHSSAKNDSILSHYHQDIIHHDDIIYPIEDDFHHDHYDDFHIHSHDDLLHDDLLHDNIVYSHSKEPSVPMKPGLGERQQKYCSCALKVKNARNPYAVCAKSTGTSYRNCGDYYDYERMEDKHLITYGERKGITIPSPYDRRKMIDAIYQWKLSHN